MFTVSDLSARVRGLEQLTRGLAKEVAPWKEGNDPLLYLERKAYLAAVQTAPAGLDDARMVLAGARQRLLDGARVEGATAEGGVMPSTSLRQWRNDRTPRLAQIEAQCAASLAAVPPNALLVEENLRGYVVLLSAHFQAYCRDLYSEAALLIIGRGRIRLRPLFLRQFAAHLALNYGNPNIDNIAKDYDRFGFDLRAELNADLANTPRRHHLAALNQWRNVAAHQGTQFPAGGPLTLPVIQAWRGSCDGLATSLDAILYTELRKILRRRPW